MNNEQKINNEQRAQKSAMGTSQTMHWSDMILRRVVGE